MGTINRMDISRQLTDIWNDVLGSDGSSDPLALDFFEAGGDSIAVLEFTTRVNDEIGVDIPLETIFTTGSLAAVIDECRRQMSGAGVDIDPA